MANLNLAQVNYSYDGTNYKAYNVIQVTGGASLTITNPSPGIALATISAPSTTMVWQTPALNTNISNYGSGWDTAGYYKDSTGRVFLKGLIMGTGLTVGTTIFVLPVGFRPPADQMFCVNGYNTAVNAYRLDVDSDGTIAINSVVSGGTGNPTSWFSLNGISFLTY